MAMTLSGKNLYLFLSYISPFLLAFTLIFFGFVNSEPLKPLMYLGCLLSTMAIVVFFLKFDSSKQPSMNPMCGMFKFLDDEFYRPTISTYFITFTLVYCLLPMIMSGNTNYYFIALVLFLLVSDTTTKFSFGCVNMNGVFLSIVTSILLGSLTAIGIFHTEPELLFFGGKSSNNVVCNKPSNKTFKCSVYKNGQLLKTL